MDLLKIRVKAVLVPVLLLEVKLCNGHDGDCLRVAWLATASFREEEEEHKEKRRKKSGML